MTENFHRPVRMSAGRLEASLSGDPAEGVIDPAEASEIASQTARALMSRTRDSHSAELVARVVSFTDEHGLDTLAELWARSRPSSLPGALWRLYLVRAIVHHNPEDARALFQRGIDDLATIDRVVAGAPEPLSPEGFARLLDDILRGAFVGELSGALSRAAAVARAVSAGAISLAWTTEEHASYLTGRSLNWSVIADELSHAAGLARAGTLD
jgi:hypothetical protein